MPFKKNVKIICDFCDFMYLEEVGWKYYKLQYLPFGPKGEYDYLSWRDSQIKKLLSESKKNVKKKLIELAYSLPPSEL